MTNTILRDALRQIATFAASPSDIARAALAAADADQAPDAVYAVLYDDNDMRPAVVVGEAAARATFERIGQKGYNAHLFVKVQSNSRDDPYHHMNAARPAPVGAVQAPDVAEAMGPFGAGPMTRVCIGGVPLGDYIKAKAAAPAAPIVATPKLTECRHCGFFVALNQAPAEQAKPEPAREMTQQERHDDGVAKLMASGDRFAKPEPVDMGNHISVEQARLVEGASKMQFDSFLREEAPFDYDASNADAWHIWQAAYTAGQQAGAVDGASDQDLLKLACLHTGKRVSLAVAECFEHIDFGRAAIAAANQKGE
jgi:hypothetical protein